MAEAAAAGAASSSSSLTQHDVLERQVEEQGQRIADLKASLAQKEALYLATSDQLRASENKRIELETSLVNLATGQDDVAGGASASAGSHDEADDAAAKDTFVASNCRAAKLEQETNDLKYKLTHLSSAIADFNAAFNESLLGSGGGGGNACPPEAAAPNLKEQLEKLYNLATTRPALVKLPSTEKGSLQLQVKIELEHERRLRTQQALDEAERRQYVLQRDCDNKTRECQEYSQKIKDLKVKHEARVRQVTEENRRLEKLLQLKESEIMDSEARAKELVMRAEEFEDMFNGQLEIVKRLQTDLTTAYNEKKVLVKEMEALNEMFANMETKYITEAAVGGGAKGGGGGGQDSSAASTDSLVEDAAAQTSCGPSPTASVLEDSCFKEVKTKNGTRMVLSVSKTYMKLRDLILEKKTLEEQVEKMKAVNTRLCSRVNLHEEKLFNITDELNKTWTYVSTLKYQHKQLHTSEQILRAELTEKRQLLAKLREELEYSRESWNIVKKKTADSEREWRALRDEFAARRRALPSASSESGFSDDHSSETNDESEQLHPTTAVNSTAAEEASKAAAADTPTAKEDSSTSSPLPSVPEEALTEDTPEQGDPEGSFSQDEEDTEPSLSPPPPPPPAPGEEGEQAPPGEEEDAAAEASATEQPATFPLFIPSLRFMAEVPAEMLPPLFPSDRASSTMAENYQELYQKLVASTARSAALANQLAEMHHKFQNVSSLDEVDGDDDDDEEVEPKTDDESIVNNEEESEILISEVDSIKGEEVESIYAEEDPAAASAAVATTGPTSTTTSGDYDEEEEEEEELEDLGLSAEAIEAALANFRGDGESSDGSTVSSSRRTSLTSSPPPDTDDMDADEPFFDQPAGSATAAAAAAAPAGLATTASTATVVFQPAMAPAAYQLSTASSAVAAGALRVYANMDSLDDSSSSSDGDGGGGDDDDDTAGEEADEEGENASTAVTRFLIKRLPKQLSKLRNDKAELEERILDLEQTISNQNQAMLEMERRVDVYKKEAETARKWNASLSLSIGKQANNEALGGKHDTDDDDDDETSNKQPASGSSAQ